MGSAMFNRKISEISDFSAPTIASMRCARRLPPLNPLRMFEAAARHNSFTGAARELGVTQAAVSRQIVVLEHFLGVRLFEREKSSVRLTRAGERYYEKTHQALDLLSESTAELLRTDDKVTLSVQCYSTFALRWLIPRLAQFQEKHPSFCINVITATMAVDFEHHGVDVAIHTGQANRPGLVSERFLPDTVVPVCSPKLLSKCGRLRKPADFAGHVLIHSWNRRGDWALWQRTVGVNLEKGPQAFYETSNLAYEAAAQGLGIAIAQPLFVQSELREGRLVVPFPIQAENEIPLYLIRQRRSRASSHVNVFCDWLSTEAQLAIETISLAPPSPPATARAIPGSERACPDNL